MANRLTRTAHSRRSWHYRRSPPARFPHPSPDRTASVPRIPQQPRLHQIVQKIPQRIVTERLSCAGLNSRIVISSPATGPSSTCPSPTASAPKARFAVDDRYAPATSARHNFRISARAPHARRAPSLGQHRADIGPGTRRNRVRRQPSSAEGQSRPGERAIAATPAARAPPPIRRPSAMTPNGELTGHGNRPETGPPPFVRSENNSRRRGAGRAFPASDRVG